MLLNLQNPEDLFSPRKDDLPPKKEEVIVHPKLHKAASVDREAVSFLGSGEGERSRRRTRGSPKPALKFPSLSSTPSCTTIAIHCPVFSITPIFVLLSESQWEKLPAVKAQRIVQVAWRSSHQLALVHVERNVARALPRLLLWLGRYIARFDLVDIWWQEIARTDLVDECQEPLNLLPHQFDFAGTEKALRRRIIQDYCNLYEQYCK